VILFHRTPAADAIVSEGFRDATEPYGTSAFHTGVWLSDHPLGENEGGVGDDIVMVDIPEDDIALFEWMGRPSFGYREWLVPAAIVNAYPRQQGVECGMCGALLAAEGTCAECGSP
jgi:hypothetical protein